MNKYTPQKIWDAISYPCPRFRQSLLVKGAPVRHLFEPASNFLFFAMINGTWYVVRYIDTMIVVLKHDSTYKHNKFTCWLASFLRNFTKLWKCNIILQRNLACHSLGNLSVTVVQTYERMNNSSNYGITLYHARNLLTHLKYILWLHGWYLHGPGYWKRITTKHIWRTFLSCFSFSDKRRTSWHELVVVTCIKKVLLRPW